MAILNSIILVLIGMAFLVLGIGFVLVITKNMRQGRVFRKQLARHIESLRMGRMLRALGIDASSYLHEVPVHQVNANARNCEACQTTEVCDESLQREKLHPDEVDFCPNQQSLADFRQTRESKSAS